MADHHSAPEPIVSIDLDGEELDTAHPDDLGGAAHLTDRARKKQSAEG